MERLSRGTIIKYLTILISVILLVRPIFNLYNLITNIPAVSIVLGSSNEMRDYASMRLAHFIYSGINPYTVDFPNATNVPFMNLYPALTPLLVSLTCHVVGTTILEGFYLVNIVLVVFTCLFIWMTIRDHITDHKTVFLVCTLINVTTFFCLFGYGDAGNPIFNFHADTVGICLTSLIFLIVYKNKNNTMLLAILSVMLIFTKQILLILVLPLFILYLLIDRKLALKYFLQCSIIGIITFVVINMLFPLYWTETIYAQFIVISDLGGIAKSLENIGDFYIRYSMYLILFAVGAVVSRIISKKSRSEYDKSEKKSLKTLINKEYFVFYLILNVVIGTLSLIYIARNYEDGYKYCQDILGPSWFLLGTIMWIKCLNNATKKENLIRIANSLITVGFCLATLFAYSHFWSNLYDKNDVYHHLQLDMLLQENAGGNMYLGMGSTQFMLNREVWESDNIWFSDGMNEYFNVECPESSLLNDLFYAEELIEAGQRYRAEVNDMVANKEFDIIAINDAEGIIDMDNLEQNYELYRSFLIKTDSNGVFDVDVWIPAE